LADETFFPFSFFPLLSTYAVETGISPGRLLWAAMLNTRRSSPGNLIQKKIRLRKWRKFGTANLWQEPQYPALNEKRKRLQIHYDLTENPLKPEANSDFCRKLLQLKQRKHHQKF